MDIKLKGSAFSEYPTESEEQMCNIYIENKSYVYS